MGIKDFIENDLDKEEEIKKYKPLPTSDILEDIPPVEDIKKERKIVWMRFFRYLFYIASIVCMVFLIISAQQGKFQSIYNPQTNITNICEKQECVCPDVTCESDYINITLPEVKCSCEGGYYGNST